MTELSGGDEPCSMMIGESAINPFRKFSDYILLTHILPEGIEVAMAILPYVLTNRIIILVPAIILE
jgi:hypothetical protein